MTNDPRTASHDIFNYSAIKGKKWGQVQQDFIVEDDNSSLEIDEN